MEWFIFAIFATVLFAIQSLLFKTSSAKKCDKELVTLIFVGTVWVFSIILFLIKGIKTQNILLAMSLGILFAIAFYIKTFSQLKALDFLPTNRVFPITSSSLILVIIYAIIFFDESLTINQIIGIFFILLSIVLIHQNSRKKFSKESVKKGFFFVFLAIPFGALMNISNKYASINLPPEMFIAVTYFFLTVIALGKYFSKKGNLKKASPKNSIKIGLVIGAINFSGYLAYLTALKTGPLSLVASIHATYVIITIILAKMIHSETLDLKQFGLVILAVLGVILLKI